MELIKQFLQQGSDSDEQAELFITKMVQYDFDKNSTILKAGQVENYLSFIETGVLRYWAAKGDKEITADFSFAGAFTSAYSSFITREPSAFNVQALTATSLWRISHTDLQEIYRTHPHAQMIGRIAAEQLFIRKTKRELSLLTQTAEERYLLLLNDQTDMIQQIPLKYLCSYIGITPQALSRIRNRIS